MVTTLWFSTSLDVAIKECVDVINIYNHWTLSGSPSVTWVGLIQSVKDLKSKD